MSRQTSIIWPVTLTILGFWNGILETRPSTSSGSASLKGRIACRMCPHATFVDDPKTSGNQIVPTKSGSSAALANKNSKCSRHIPLPRRRTCLCRRHCRRAGVWQAVDLCRGSQRMMHWSHRPPGQLPGWSIAAYASWSGRRCLPARAALHPMVHRACPPDRTADRPRSYRADCISASESQSGSRERR